MEKKARNLHKVLHMFHQTKGSAHPTGTLKRRRHVQLSELADPLGTALFLKIDKFFTSDLIMRLNKGAS